MHTEDLLMRQSFPASLQIGEHKFQSGDQILESITTLQPTDSYSIINACVDKLLGVHKQIELTLVRLCNYVVQHKLWTGTESEDAFKSRWASVLTIKKRRKRDYDYIKSQHKTACAAWGKENTERLFMSLFFAPPPLPRLS
ncbi:hypothetical protein N7450_005404 [Penicillium hetheringtonii]|uniref:Uncharacterized protein n=1 Tax=Penicillium hetheringtonii TaxID=911720 RepID=A0AAD6DT99_9EURO|nr:hypothetical protein N7450_005404 [Penicillium hetheringtonii]